MPDSSYLKGRRILAVDDEEDVLEIIREQLEECALSTATDFDAAKKLLDTERFDLVILDIMGVGGFELLDLTRDRQMPTVMLTAHALTPEGLQRSIDEGAVSFLPKDELNRLSEQVEEILREMDKGRSHWPAMREQLAPRFRRLWGKLWDRIRFPQDPKEGG